VREFSAPLPGKTTKRGRMRQYIISEKAAAQRFRISTRKIRESFKSARIAPGEYDLLQFIDIYVEEKDEIDASKAIKEKELEIKDTKLKILKGEYHHEADVRMIVSDMLIRFAGKLKSIPQKLANSIAGLNNPREIEEKLREGVNEALEELSDYTYKPVNKKLLK